MTNTVATPNLGRAQVVGLGAQVDPDTPVAATVFIPITGGSNPLPEYNWKSPDFADGNLWEAPAQLMGIKFENQNRQFLPTFSNLDFLTRSLLMIQASDFNSTTKVLTPPGFKNWHRGRPVPALTLEENHPSYQCRVSDVQLFKLSLSFASEDFFNGQFDFHGVKPEEASTITPAFTFATPAYPAAGDFINWADVSVLVDGTVVPVQSGDITIEVPMTGKKQADGTNNLFTTIFERNGNISLLINFMTFGKVAALDAAYTSSTPVTKTVVFRIKRGTKYWEVTSTMQITAVDIPGGLDIIDQKYSCKAVSADNATAPFTIKMVLV